MLFTKNKIRKMNFSFAQKYVHLNKYIYEKRFGKIQLDLNLNNY